MASIQKYKTKTGTKWLFKLDLGKDPKTGKRKTTTKRGFATERQAKIASAKLFNEINAGNYVQEQKIIFEDFIDKWLKEYEHSGIKTSTLVNRKTTAIPHLKRLIGKCLLGEVNAKHFFEMLTTLQQEGYSVDTVNNVYVTGRMILKNALQKGLVRELPIINKPKKKKTIDDLLNERVEENYLEKSELKCLLDTAQKHGTLIDYVIFLTLAYTGVRIGELIALKWEDIDFEKKTIHVWKTLFREKNTMTEFELTPPKTRKSIRLIPIGDKLIEALQELLVQQMELRRSQAMVIDEGFVFVKMSGDYCGYPKNRRLIGARMKNYLRLAGITKNITLHKLRHTHVSLLAEAGVDLPTIQERVGHEDSKTTLKIYLHITTKLKVDAVNKFNQLMDF